MEVDSDAPTSSEPAPAAASSVEMTGKTNSGAPVGANVEAKNDNEEEEETEDLLAKLVSSAHADKTSDYPRSPDLKRTKLTENAPASSKDLEPSTSGVNAGGPSCDPETLEGDIHIATESELEAFVRLPVEQRTLHRSLRGVLAETAMTGVVRYKWALLRPLVEFVLEKVLCSFDTNGNDAGPSRHTQYFGESLLQTISRFKTYLSSFTQAPWTLQRLCEILLEPQKQYVQLHKVALAIERLLMVTGEVEPSRDPPALPCLSSLAHINDNPAPVYVSNSGPRVRSVSDDVSAAFTATFMQIRAAGGDHDTAAAAAEHTNSHAGVASAGGSPPCEKAHHAHPNQHSPSGGSSGMEHIEEDHWPEQNLAATGLLGAGGGPLLATAVQQFNEKHAHHGPGQQDGAASTTPGAQAGTS